MSLLLSDAVFCSNYLQTIDWSIFISDYCANLFHYDATSCHLNEKGWNKKCPILILQ